MTTARQIISDALTISLNRLSPGEALDDDLAALCLSALNHVADSLNGGNIGLFREIISSGTVTGSTGTLGTTWPGIAPGTKILGVTAGDQEIALSPITMQQYHEMSGVPTSAAIPMVYAHDGASTLYFIPASTGLTVKVRTRQPVSDFADLDTVAVLPAGYRSALSALLAKAVAPAVLGNIPATVARDAAAARRQIAAFNANPSILNRVLAPYAPFAFLAASGGGGGSGGGTSSYSIKVDGVDLLVDGYPIVVSGTSGALGALDLGGLLTLS